MVSLGIFIGDNQYSLGKLLEVAMVWAYHYEVLEVNSDFSNAPPIPHCWNTTAVWPVVFDVVVNLYKINNRVKHLFTFAYFPLLIG